MAVPSPQYPNVTQVHKKLLAIVTVPLSELSSAVAQIHLQHLGRSSERVLGELVYLWLECFLCSLKGTDTPYVNLDCYFMQLWLKHHPPGQYWGWKECRIRQCGVLILTSTLLLIRLLAKTFFCQRHLRFPPRLSEGGWEAGQSLASKGEGRCRTLSIQSLAAAERERGWLTEGSNANLSLWLSYTARRGWRRDGKADRGGGGSLPGLLIRRSGKEAVAAESPPAKWLRLLSERRARGFAPLPLSLLISPRVIEVESGGRSRRLQTWRGPKASQQVMGLRVPRAGTGRHCVVWREALPSGKIATRSNAEDALEGDRQWLRACGVEWG